MDTAVALFQKKFFFGRQLCLQPVVTSPPGENGRWNTRNTRNKEREGEGGREKLWRDHEIFIPLKSLLVVTINNHESRNNVPPGSTTASFLSFFLSLRLSSNFPSLSLSRSVVDVSLPR